MIRSDLEGATGVVSYEQTEPGKIEYCLGKKMFMADLIAMIEGLNAGGADEIIVYDEHYYGRNIDLDLLPENVLAICGKPPYRKDWAGGLDKTFTGLILLGLHSKYGTLSGLLHHTYEHDIKNIILNGTSIGEIGMESAVAGDYNVPLLLITGDSAGVDEARNLVPGVEGVIVKESICEWGAKCYPLKTTSAMIQKKAKEIVKNKPSVNSYNLGNKVTLKIEFNTGPYLNTFYQIYNNKMDSRNTILLEGKSATEVWSMYWAMKLNTQKEMRK